MLGTYEKNLKKGKYDYIFYTLYNKIHTNVFKKHYLEKNANLLPQ